MIIVNTLEVPNRKIIESCGIVKGSSVRAKWFGKDILAGLRNIVGGELKEYKELLDESRDAAVERMVAEAKRLNADAIVNVHFMTAGVSAGAAEILVYGTAVKLK